MTTTITYQIDSDEYFVLNREERLPFEEAVESLKQKVKLIKNLGLTYGRHVSIVKGLVQGSEHTFVYTPEFSITL